MYEDWKPQVLLMYMQIKASEQDTILCYESFFNTQVQMLICFNSLLFDKVQCVSSGNILPEFFSSPLYVHCTNFFFFAPFLRSKVVGPLGFLVTSALIEHVKKVFRLKSQKKSKKKKKRSASAP